jgi:CRISPR/Cas system CSM-associated protein Csm3 (group 7 of RAMP superfamily)
MQLRIQLLSDTTFGRGDGVIGLVDSEVEHDAETGMPFVKGRTIKGILVESCADILYALQESKSGALGVFKASAKKMFGQPGSTLEDTGCLHIGAAKLAEDLQSRIRRSNYIATQILEALTTIRHQTAVDTGTDRPDSGSLRATRAVLRNTVFYSSVVSNQDLNEDDLALLAACAAGMRRAGQSRTRGRGRIAVRLDVDNVSKDYYLSIFEKQVRGT